MRQAQVIIIGGGPAGMITAIQLQRYGITPALFEPHRLGGLLWNANLVENYPGFPQGISGPELAARFRKHYESLGLRVTPELVEELDFEGGNFMVRTPENLFSARVVVIASGTRPHPFPTGLIAPEAQSRVFYEVVPLLEVKGKEIAIIGAGDAAFDYALNLSANNHVVILNRGEEVKALPLLVTRVQQNENIRYIPNTLIRHVTLDGKQLLLQASHGDEFRADYLIGAIGRSENCPEFGDRLKAEETRLVELGRLYYIGDIRNGIFRQTAIATGDGLKAAMQIHHYLTEDG